MRFEAVVVPNGGSGTHAGLAAGLAAPGDTPARTLSVTVQAPIEKTVANTRCIATDVLRLLDRGRALPGDEILIDASQQGEGYDLPTKPWTIAAAVLHGSACPTARLSTGRSARRSQRATRSLANTL